MAVADLVVVLLVLVVISINTEMIIIHLERKLLMNL